MCSPIGEDDCMALGFNLVVLLPARTHNYPVWPPVLVRGCVSCVYCGVAEPTNVRSCLTHLFVSHDSRLQLAMLVSCTWAGWDRGDAGRRGQQFWVLMLVFPCSKCLASFFFFLSSGWKQDTTIAQCAKQGSHVITLFRCMAVGAHERIHGGAARCCRRRFV